MAAPASDEIIEHTLAQIPECFLFELPPRVRAQGWLAADMTKQMWTGRLRVVQRGMEAAIMLIDRRDGKLFAMSKVTKGAVERVPDSSRYFVLKIQNAQGRHAFVGLAFDDRNDAFDFNVALQEFERDVERTAKLTARGEGDDNGGKTTAPTLSTDLSLKEGEKIKIGIAGSKPSSRPRRSNATGSGGGGGLLAPPPGDTARKLGSGGGLLAPPPGDTRRARSRQQTAPPGSRAQQTGEQKLQHAPGISSSPATLTAVEAPAQAPAPAVLSQDDDPFGLGLSHASQSSAGAPSSQADHSWGLSDLSSLGTGLPSAPRVESTGTGSNAGRTPGSQSHQLNDDGFLM